MAVYVVYAPQDKQDLVAFLRARCDALER